MGRRAPRKIDSSLDLQGWLCELETLPLPVQVETLFGRQAPLEVEVGSGKGLFLSSAAPAHPDRDFLGCEIAAKFAKLCAARLAKAELPNARIVHGDAQRLLREGFGDDSVAAVHVYFPDPWWKKRHKKRRVLNTGLVQQVERILVPGGRLHFWTDVEEYFQSTLELLAAETKLQGPVEVAERPAEHHLDYRTHFERRTRMAGETVYRAEYVKGS
jgi:tRNA (guanine-N7-)-methyltransferase